MFFKIKFGLIAFLIVSIFFVCNAALSQPARLTPQAGPFNSVQIPANLQGVLDECGDYYVFPVEEGSFGAIPEGYDEGVPTAGMRVPAYGYFESEVFPADDVKVFAQNSEGFSYPHALRALWEGYTIVWVDKNVAPAAYDFVADYFTEQNAANPDSKVIVVPWVDEVASIPEGRSFAYSTWGSSQSCGSFTIDSFEDFEQVAADNLVDREIDSPPVVELDTDGLLPNLNPYRN